MYELPYPPPGTQWVRYWNDALLVDMYTRRSRRRDPRLLLVERGQLLIEGALRPSRSAPFAFAPQT